MIALENSWFNDEGCEAKGAEPAGAVGLEKLQLAGGVAPSASWRRGVAGGDGPTLVREKYMSRIYVEHTGAVTAVQPSIGS